MKINIEEIDKELYFDIVLTMKEYMSLYDKNLITKEVKKNKKTYNVGIQVDVEDEYT